MIPDDLDLLGGAVASVDRSLIERLLSEVSDLRREVIDSAKAVSAMQAEMSSFVSVASQKLEESERASERAEATAQKALHQLRVVKLWAAAAAFFVPATLGIVAWVLAKIPPTAWSVIAQ